MPSRLRLRSAEAFDWLAAERAAVTDPALLACYDERLPFRTDRGGVLHFAFTGPGRPWCGPLPTPAALHPLSANDLLVAAAADAPAGALVVCGCLASPRTPPGLLELLAPGAPHRLHTAAQRTRRIHAAARRTAFRSAG